MKIGVIEEMNAPATENIKRIIQEKGLKQIYVAKAAGFTAQEFYDVLANRRLLKVRDVVMLSKVLAVDPNELCKLPEKEKLYDDSRKGV